VIWLSIGVLVAIAALVILTRDRIAHLQSALAGGAVRPGCAVAQAAALLLLALLILLGYVAGMF
jgi:hypothetical protein